MRLSGLSRLHPHMLWNRHYWWKAYKSVHERLTRETHLESLIGENIELLWSPVSVTRLERVATDGVGDQPLRILYVAPRHDYGNPARGLSYEENNFFHVLYSMGHEIIRFDFPSIMRCIDRHRMNKLLLEVAYRYQPDLAFFVLFTDEFDHETIAELSDSGVTLTVNWFTDDHWRFDTFSSHWAPCFNWIVTTVKEAVVKYQQLGIDHVILSQWGVNHRLYYKMDQPRCYDVTFIGQPHGIRRAIIKRLRAAGIEVKTWGYGWKQGKVTQREMVQIFNQTKINLNLSNASVPGTDQIKGRNFEIPGCGGFLLTGYAPHLEEYYDIGKEIVCFDDIDDLIDKIRYYLAHEDERETIAKAGYQRTRAEHTYERRFQAILSKMQIP